MANPHHAGIVLCGGHSQRMGVAKAWLPFGPQAMLQRVVQTLQSCVPTIVVVAAAGQLLPSLPDSVLIARDAAPDRGPLEGLLAGLRMLPADVSAAFVTSCDVPLLSTAFVARMLELADNSVITFPLEGERRHPLSAVYRPCVIAAAESLLAQDNRRLMSLLDSVAARAIVVEELRDVDPELDSLRNLNTPEDYFAAVAAAGFEVPEEVHRQLQR